MNNLVPIGLSGGIDSMSLLHYLINRTSYDPYALHFHHGDEYSQRVYELVKGYCKKLNIPIKVGYIQPINNPSEDYWRKERYKFFDEAVKGFNKPLLLAHHYTDQEVSYVTNCLKGSKRGFIPPVSYRREYEIHRPLHLISKIEIKEYGRINNLPYMEDPTNSTSQRGKIEEKIEELKLIVSQMEGAIKNKYIAYLHKNQFSCSPNIRTLL